MLETWGFQGMPDWINENLFRWIASNGIAVVLSVLILGLVVTPLFLMNRLLISGMGTQISAAVTLFSGTLSAMANRQEQTSDYLAETIKENTAATQELARLVASMNESIRIQLNFTTQQMAQQAALTQQVARASGQEPISGIIKPVKPVEEGHDGASG